MGDLMLDSAIRDWVLVPLTLVMILVGVLRHHVERMTKTEPVVELKNLREGQVVLRARVLRGSARHIPERAFRMRRHFFNNTETGLLYVPKGAQGPNAAATMMNDPNVATNMMKQNLSMIVPQTLMFAWVNFFFSGFVTAKIPFPLTQRFRSMLQNGIDLSSVDVSYVSSRSWYFMNMFGLRGLFSLILGEGSVDDAQRMMQTQMAMQMGGFGADPNKTLTAEKEALDLLQHESALANVEQRTEHLLHRLLHSRA